MMFPPDPSPAAVAAALDRLAAQTGDPAYARAAKALLALPSPGREPIDDALALAEAREILARNPGMSRWSALLLVARRLGPLGKERSTAERLRRKWEKTVSVRNIHEIAISGKSDGLSLRLEINPETV